jgi:hypothetical protein
VILHGVWKYIYYGFYVEGGSIADVDINGILKLKLSSIFGFQNTVRDKASEKIQRPHDTPTSSEVFFVVGNPLSN